MTASAGGDQGGAAGGAPGGSEGDLVGPAEASRLLEVAPGRLDAMVEEGVLTPVGDGPDRRFRLAEVLAARQLGG